MQHGVQGGLPERLVARLLRQLFLALQHLSSCGVEHQDVRGPKYSDLRILGGILTTFDNIASLRMFMDVCLVCLQVSIFWKFYSNVRLVRPLEWLAEQCWRHALFQGETRKYDALWCGCALAEIYITPCGTLEDFGSPEATFADSVV
jgi:hypothetical protein